MGVIIAFFAFIIVLDTIIFWAFIETFRDKDFSEGLGIGECLAQCGIATLMGVAVKLMAFPAPLHLFYLFKPFQKIGLNIVAQILCLLIMGAMEIGIGMVFAKPLIAAINAL